MTARGILVPLVAATAVVFLALPALGSGQGNARSGVPKLVFPLVAKTLWWDNYGDPRPNGRHAGIDIMTPWRSSVVAVEAGRVKYWESGLGGCMLYLYGRSGTMYMYIHLNNDVTAANDNRGRCHEVAFAVPDGAKVGAGEQIAWSGDSGDANGNPHLHFEVHPNGGTDVNPFPHLSRASRPLFAAKLGSDFSLGLRGRLLAVGGGVVELQVERVRHYPGGRWLDLDKRTLELEVPPDAEVAPGFAGASALAVRQLRTPIAVTANTAKAKTTTEAMIGVAGALTASRLSPAR